MNKMMDFFYKYEIKNILIIIFLISITVYISTFFDRDQTITGFFLLVSILMGSLFALHKYHTESRISRLQKIYFENTLLAEANSLEEMMSQTNRNMMNIESLYWLANNILTQNGVSFENLQEELNTIFD